MGLQRIKGLPSMGHLPQLHEQGKAPPAIGDTPMTHTEDIARLRCRILGRESAIHHLTSLVQYMKARNTEDDILMRELIDEQHEVV